MLEPKSVVESIADLRRLGSSFRSLIAYAGDDAVKHWHRLRAMGDTILNDIWLETHSSPRSAFDAIEGFRNQDLSAWPRSSCDHNRFFKKLVGFEFEPRYRSFMAPWPFFFEDGSHLTRELCFSSGLVFQPVIPVDPELADDLERLWPLHRFELLDRCANGCEMIIEIIEREMAADNQADEDGLGFQLNGTLTENDRSILIAMLDLKADKIHPRAGEEILGAVIFEYEVGDSKRAFDNLKGLKLIESKTGPSGGRWLTEQGMAIAKDLKSRSDGIVPTN
jgi:hypothetical protein